MNLGFFEALPTIAIVGLALIIGVAVWMIWRSIAPAAPGIGLGYYEVVGRYSGQRLVKRLRGTLVECTAIFLQPHIEEQLRLFLLAVLDEIKKHQTEDSSKLDELRVQLEKRGVPLSKYIRIIATRVKLFSKHIIIQWRYVDKPLNAYAAHDPESRFTLGFGFLSQGVITGEIYTSPSKWQIYRLGKVYVHFFIPDVTSNEEAREPPEYLAKLALYAPATVEFHHLLKAKDQEVKEKERDRERMGKEIGTLATLVDSLVTAVKGFTTAMPPEKGLTRKKFDLIDFVTLALPTLFGYLFADYLALNPVIGMFGGMFLGAYIIFRKG